jgi:glycosyltransferase involved in cell wall biosynthesis
MVTTIIPTIGRPTLWTRALPSVMVQAGDWECVIVGDGFLPIFEHPRVRCLMVPASSEADPLRAWRHGGVDAFNAGLAAAGGEWVSYLADDDAYRPNHHADLLAGSGGADIVYGQSRIRGTDRCYGNRWPLEPYDVVQGSYLMRRAVAMPATKPTDRSWDAQWWQDALSRGLRSRMVGSFVHEYFPAPESAHHHGLAR